MTAEVTFAKTFLNVLDAKTVKLQSDHAADLRTLELSAPYTLPRMPQPMQKPASQLSSAAPPPGSEPAVTVALKSLRNPPLDLSLPAQPLATTSVLDLKQRVAKELGLPGVDKVRLLYKKKPCADSKSVKDVLGDEAPGAAGVEFSVMVMGGGPSATGAGAGATAAAPAPAATEDAQMAEAPVAPGEESGVEVLSKDEFWVDLKGFLEQRVKDSGVADRAVTVFLAAWKEKGELS